jgi:xanthine/uracil permease
LLIAKLRQGLCQANISVLLGIVIGGCGRDRPGLMNFDKVAKAAGLIWFCRSSSPYRVRPDADPHDDLVMVVVMIESTGMFLALGDMTGKEVDQGDLARGLRTDGLGTLIGGIFNTFPYTSFSQNVGLVARDRVKSRFVCVAAV